MSGKTTSTGRFSMALSALLLILTATPAFPVQGGIRNSSGNVPQSPTATGKTGEGETGRVYESVQGGFRIRLPKDFRDPIKQNRYLKNQVKSFPTFLSLGDRGSFTILPVDPPRGLEANPENLRNIARTEFQITASVAEREVPLERKGEKGLEFFVKSKVGQQAQYARLQFIAAPHRWFEVVFISMVKDHREEPDINEAFTSFEVLPAVQIKDFKPETTPTLPFEPLDKGFQLELPSGFQPPIDQSPALASQVKGLKVSQFISNGPTGLIVMTRFSEIRGMTTPEQINQVREGLTAGILKTMNGRIFKSTSLNRQDISCQEIRFTGEISGQALNGRGLLYGQKGILHLFFYLAPATTTLESPEAERFFKSIRIAR